MAVHNVPMSTIPLPLTVLITGMILSRSHANCNVSLCVHLHVYRYQPIPALISRINKLHHEYILVSKQLDRLKRKIAEASESTGVTLDEKTHDDFKNMITSSDSSAFFENLPKDSFPYIFWQQQVEAAKKKVAKSMR